MFFFVQHFNAEKVLVKAPGTENPADLCTKGLGGDIIAKFTKSVNGVFSDGRPMMCPTISAISVPSQSCLGCLLPSVRKMFCYKVYVDQKIPESNLLSRSDQVSSDVPTTWSPESYRGLVRGGVQKYSTSSPHVYSKRSSNQGARRILSNGLGKQLVAAWHQSKRVMRMHTRLAQAATVV